jgi:hypothetical protein
MRADMRARPHERGHSLHVEGDPLDSATRLLCLFRIVGCRRQLQHVCARRQTVRELQPARYDERPAAGWRHQLVSNQRNRDSVRASPQTRCGLQRCPWVVNLV